MEFQLHRATGRQAYYWRIVASNNRILATSETYFNRQDCINAVNIVKANAANAPFYDMTKAA